MAIFKIYDGSAWGSPTAPKTYNGSSFDSPVMKYFDGSSWVTLTFLGDMGGLVPVVTDIIVKNTVGSGVCNSGVRFSPTGAQTTIEERSNAVYTLLGLDDAPSPVDHTGEWTSDSITPSEWEIACTGMVTGTWDFAFAAIGVYTSFATVDMVWSENRAGGKSYSAGTDRAVGTFRIREVADTANYTEFTVDASAIQT